MKFFLLINNIFFSFLIFFPFTVLFAIAFLPMLPFQRKTSDFFFFFLTCCRIFQIRNKNRDFLFKKKKIPETFKKKHLGFSSLVVLFLFYIVMMSRLVVFRISISFICFFLIFLYQYLKLILTRAFFFNCHCALIIPHVFLTGLLSIQLGRNFLSKH